ncbi:MAG TPA: signal recognition particle-docking protein FtsY [Candidatus Ornithospirochaeta avicola]|uniref:Signal recognition particle receptor FtsY n=1 Tax=Candidatus Ornithospirochaeta avicola TaxID=2840896 RepID=A0A9D1TNK6_9SPIO|nr:signal recognition particle-docking protein FtsY [Candidatus Ornithospirochaeta avicola]
MAFFKKLGEKLKNLFTGAKIDDEFFDNLEDTLIEGDLGAKLTSLVSEELKKKVKEEKITDPSLLQQEMKKILSPYISSLTVDIPKDDLSLFLMLGVNGVGKTTTIAKLSSYYSRKGNKVLLAAADTFRAAAVEQIDIHAERLNMRIVKSKTGADPGAVVFDAITSASSHGENLILADTAGRMHNKENLLKELQKIDKVIRARGIKEENYHRFLVIDATTGQNGLSQAHLFNEAVPISGIILTKYDSLAKGGALLQIGRELSIPVAFICNGEKYDDIAPFDKEEFLNQLVGL